MSVARAREVMARLRAAGITVHEWPGWESRGNGYTSNYEGIIIHHTATGFGYAFQALVSGRPDLSGPLCNTSGNVDGSVTMIAAHPANHAGAGAGPSLGPLPRTTLFNPRVWGHEIVYPGTAPMTPEQYRTAQILSRICVDVFGFGDIERARIHAETNGRGYDGKWDIGNGNGTTYNAAEFRRGAATILQQEVPDMTPEEKALLQEVRNRVASMHTKGYLEVRSNEPRAMGGDLGWFQNQMRIALAPVLTALAAATNDPDITADQVRQIVDNATAKASRDQAEFVTASIKADLLPLVDDALERIQDADNADEARRTAVEFFNIIKNVAVPDTSEQSTATNPTS